MRPLTAASGWVRSPVSAALALFCALTLAACGAAVSSSPADTGIRGTVTLGPTCPVEQIGVPCATSYAANLVITSAEDGNVVARVTSGEDGTFQVDLPPGDYIINPEPGGDPFPIGQPVDVIVEAGAFTEVEVAYDTGIR